jgi:hypothetical protein
LDEIFTSPDFDADDIPFGSVKMLKRADFVHEFIEGNPMGGRKRVLRDGGGHEFYLFDMQNADGVVGVVLEIPGRRQVTVTSGVSGPGVYGYIKYDAQGEMPNDFNVMPIIKLDKIPGK